ALRPLLGNRIYGCDDCQLACPWNRFARPARVPDFAARNGLDAATLAELFAWSQEEFDARLAGSPIRRIGHERWLRNIAVALGNVVGDEAAHAQAREVLLTRIGDASTLVREHVDWALRRQQALLHDADPERQPDRRGDHRDGDQHRDVGPVVSHPAGQDVAR
nr:hypothetical protein [Burkholderiaceae bacterium]